MANQRMSRVNELLRREVAASLYRVVPSDSIDMATVTVTHVITAPDLRKARVLVSVMGDDEHAQKTMRRLVGHRKDIQAEVTKHIVLKYTPLLTFALDQSLDTGNRVLQLLDSLDIPEDEKPPPEDESPSE